MKYLILSILLATLISCQGNNHAFFRLLPDCLQNEILDPEINVLKVGIPKDQSDKEESYWVFYEEKTFGTHLNANCEQNLCFGWCGLTTYEEIEREFDRNWTIIWER